jgi:exodeoxyribonuclease V alpha subunit
MSHYMMLQRNLLYTGMSRGKKLVILVGEEKAIAQAVRTVNATQRNTRLQELLRGTHGRQ